MIHVIPKRLIKSLWSTEMSKSLNNTPELGLVSVFAEYIEGGVCFIATVIETDTLC